MDYINNKGSDLIRRIDTNAPAIGAPVSCPTSRPSKRLGVCAAAGEADNAAASAYKRTNARTPTPLAPDEPSAISPKCRGEDELLLSLVALVRRHLKSGQSTSALSLKPPYPVTRLRARPGPRSLRAKREERIHACSTESGNQARGNRHGREEYGHRGPRERVAGHHIHQDSCRRVSSAGSM